MQSTLQTIDRILNRFTMYKVVLYGLIAFLAVADVLAFAGVIAVGPVALLVSVAILGASSYAANELLGRLFRVPVNSESYLITALILACILPPPTTAGHAALLVLTAVIAMASKYLLTRSGSHFLNPAAVGAFVMSVTGLLPATWWVATPVLLPLTGLLALVVLRKQRKFGLAFAFGIPAVAMLLLIGTAFHGMPPREVLQGAIGSWPIIFMGSIMLTEPGTLPGTRYYQLLFAVLVGVIFSSELHVGTVTATPQVALLAGNIFTLLAAPAAGAMVKLRRITRLSPDTYDLAFDRPARLRFAAGQYLEWTVPHRHADIRGNRRVFSIASSPDSPELHIGIKTNNPGSSFKRALLKLRPGARVRVAHAAGNFTLPRQPDKPLTFIAGGIGITPYVSMVRQLLDSGERRDITLFYVAASKNDFIYRDVLERAKSAGLTAHYTVGRLDDATLRDNVSRFKRSITYISGPDAMVSDCKRTLLSLGVPRGNIKTDHFTGC